MSPSSRRPDPSPRAAPPSPAHSGRPRRAGVARAALALAALAAAVATGAGLVDAGNESSQAQPTAHEHMTAAGNTAGTGASDAAPAAAAQTGSVRPTLPGGQVRTYYIAADEVTWNYAPDRRNMITGRRFGRVENTWVKRGRIRIGSRYRKSLYRQYTDASFRHRAPVPAQWRHLGFLGPVIQAEVGDTIVVHFKNQTPFPASVHPHGVFYPKHSEGAPYSDGTTGDRKADDAVAPGRQATYVWQVPERSGPGTGDGNSVMWMYHSHTDEVADVYAGLVGPMIVTKRGMARPDGSPNDVDRQFVTMFMVDDENQSPYLRTNMRRYLGRTVRVRGRASAELRENDAFAESNRMHSINGYVYGNGPMMTMRAGERVRWYVMDMGSEDDTHTPHWHGNVVTTTMGMRMDVIQLLAGSMQTVDMQPDDTGIWLFHCHVNDHITAGMATRYRVDNP